TVRFAPPAALFPYTPLFRSRAQVDLEGPPEESSGRPFAFSDPTSRGAARRIATPAPSYPCWPQNCRSTRQRSGSRAAGRGRCGRSEEHTSELQSRENLVCRL